MPTPALITAAENAGRIGHAEAFALRLKALRGARLPVQYRSRVPWDATIPVLAMRNYLRHGGRQRFLARGPADPLVRLAQPVWRLLGLSPGVDDCFADSPQLHGYDTAHFHFQYPQRRLGAGLFLRNYADAFETAWHNEIERDGWAAPPAPKNHEFGGRYLVVIDFAILPPGVYGLTTTLDDAGDNPVTPWNEGDAQSSCIVINANFTPLIFPDSDPRAALTSTAGHEFNHAIQFGLGALNDDPASGMFAEAGATWMEDQAFDDANDNYNYLWPDLSDNMATHSASVYGYFIVLRSFTERFGPGGAGVMKDFWELVSQRRARDVHAMAVALGSRGVQIGQAFHDAGIAIAALHACGGAYVQPHCFEEAAGYKAVGGPAPNDAILKRGATYDGTVEDDLAMRRFAIPASGAYRVTVSNRSQGGALRASTVCDDGQGLRIVTLPSTLAAGAAGTLDVNASGCGFVRLVVTNEAISAGIPSSVPARSFRVAVS